MSLALSRLDAPPAAVLARIENVRVAPAVPARVVIDQRSGTIVLGETVRISPVAVSQGNLDIRVEERPVAVVPNPFGGGETVVLPRTGLEIDEGGEGRFAVVDDGVSLADLVSALNALGVGPRDMIDILTAIDAAGALHAELVLR